MNKRIMVLPVAVLSLSALIGCNGGGGNKPSNPTIEEEIDEALKLPDNLNGITIDEARKITNSASNNFNKLIGIQSKNYSKNQYSKVYTGTYTKLIKDNLITYEVESKHYVEQGTTNPVLTINTKKHDEEIEGGTTITYDATRSDTVFIKNDKVYDNVETYIPTSFGTDPIEGQADITSKVDAVGEGTLSEDLTSYIKSNELLKLGNDKNASDLGYFFQNGNDAYCIKFSTTNTKIKNNFDLTKSINVTVKSKVVMHFIYENDAWKSLTYATSLDKYFDRDLNDKMFDTPVLVTTEKYYSKAVYGDKQEYDVSTIKNPADKLATSIMYAYLPSSEAISDETIKDIANSYTLRDVSQYVRSISGGDNYYFTIITGENDVSPTGPEQKTKTNLSTTTQVANDKFASSDPIHFLNELYNDSYITQKNSNLEYTTCILSPERRYNFRVSLADQGKISFVEDASKHTIPKGWKFANGVLEKDDTNDAVEGNYYVTVCVPQDESGIHTDSCTLKVEFKNETSGKLDNTAYSIKLRHDTSIDNNYKYQIVTTNYEDGNPVGDPEVKEIGSLTQDEELYLFNDTNSCVQTIRLVPNDTFYIREQDITLENGIAKREGNTGSITIMPNELNSNIDAKLNYVQKKDNVINVIFCMKGNTESQRPLIEGIDGSKVLVDKREDGSHFVYYDILKDDKSPTVTKIKLHIFNKNGSDANSIDYSVYYIQDRKQVSSSTPDADGKFGFSYSLIYDWMGGGVIPATSNGPVYICVSVMS